MEQMRDQKMHADLLRGALIVGPAIGVTLASGAAIPAVLGLKARPALIKTCPTPATADCPAFRPASVQEMRGQKLHADLLRGALIVWAAIGVVKVHLSSLLLLIFLYLSLFFLPFAFAIPLLCFV